MSRRQVPEINAGSMADIAFLLLIFFLVTTTMEVDQGISVILPQKMENQPPINIKERNVLNVKANKFDQLLVNGEPLEIQDLYQKTRDFYQHEENENLPQLTWITKELTIQKIAELRTWLQTSPDRKDYQEELQDWEERYKACEIFGAYQELPKNAIISFQNDNATSYHLYMAVRNELERAINDMRSDYTKRVWNVKFTDLDGDKPEDKEKIKLVRRMVPQRVAEKPPTKFGEED